jgi:hypothetical protein
MLIWGRLLPAADRGYTQFLHRDWRTKYIHKKLKKPHRNAAIVKNLSIL